MLEKLRQLEIEVFAFFLNTLNSAFGTALAGAFFGAAAASYLANRSNNKKFLLERLLACNTAINLTIATLQHSLGFKEQLARPIIQEFNFDKDRYLKFLSDAAEGKVAGNFEVQYNFGKVNLFRHRAHEIEGLVLSKVGVSGKTSMASTFLSQTLHSLEIAISQRQIEVERLSELKGSITDDELAHRYFGIETNSGLFDTRLSDSMTSIERQLDDTLFYSKFIFDGLILVSSSLTNQIGKSAPDQVVFTFGDEKLADLMPDKNNYPDWL